MDLPIILKGTAKTLERNSETPIMLKTVIPTAHQVRSAEAMNTPAIRDRRYSIDEMAAVSYKVCFVVCDERSPISHRRIAIGVSSES